MMTLGGANYNQSHGRALFSWESQVSQDSGEARIAHSAPRRAGEQIRVWNFEEFITQCRLLLLMFPHSREQPTSSDSTASYRELIGSANIDQRQGSTGEEGDQMLPPHREDPNQLSVEPKVLILEKLNPLLRFPAVLALVWFGLGLKAEAV